MAVYKAQNLGCLPNRSRPEVLAAVEAMAAPWDVTDQPKICTWESFKPFLEEVAQLRKTKPVPMWWELAAKMGLNPEKLLIPTQGNIGSCAGVSYFDRCYLITLIKQIARHSEQAIEPVNALATWLVSKNWRRIGGQTISAVIQEGCETGVFPASLVGEYSSGWSDRKAVQNHTSDAALRQMGACIVPDEVNKADAIDLALRAGYVVEIGNYQAVMDSTTKDENGVPLVQCAGSWSHATVFSDYMERNGKSYYRWENSHGLKYDQRGFGSPRFGAFMTRETLEEFCYGSFCDVAITTYVESPYDATITPTLEVL